jgi:hypothetical protein
VAWVEGSDILAHVAGAGTPSTAPADEAWADLVAAAIDAEVTRRLGSSTIADDDLTGMALAIKPAALQDAAALYVSRKAPHGVLETGGDGDPVRLGADSLRALNPVLWRVSPGIG